ncbi:MAG TPA: ATP-dependent Clp protease ATP-binding subunit [Bacillota bacterium]|nr:ATP-dependent Clp protease ATP-binding subunit [Bacillota bacterium]HOK69246.1 ATP-dependent Clp protease ATP-binding subunit [Bacillota bacterium]HPP85900.1 ATP-dependent Clp protease ATP-binding subunit [Bacillota bacterium]
MIIKKCARCKTRIAVIYVTKNENGKTVSEGYCLKCAKELGIKPVDDIINRMGISEDEFEAMSDEITDLMPQLDENYDLDENEEGRAPAIDLNAMLSNPEQPVPYREPRQQDGSPKEDKKPKRKFLDQFCIDLTAKAREGKIDTIVGRETELERVIQILTRRQKNNPCLIGEPGVGKTAVAEALAQRIASGNVPYKLLNKEVMLVDMTAIVAGTQFRGQFENRMKGLIEDARRSGNVILVIDEVHSIVGAGNAEGGMNAANILKPALSRGEIQLIGATTLVEYRKHIEHDAALERRFQPVMINEPSIDDTVKILAGIKGYYEKYHGIKVPDHILRRIVTLSERYITDRFLPDKAIDLLDEACSYMAINSPIVDQINRLADEIKQLEAEKAAIENKETMEESDYPRLADIKTRLLQKNQQFDALSKQRDTLELTEYHLAKVIEVWTGIPATNITENSFQKIERLESEIKKRIVGQDEAVSKVAKAIKRSRAGISYKKKPISFIFAGTTGVGKTELVKVLARILFDTPDSLIRLDMSEFMEKYSVSRIIGSPPGYIGYDDAGQLTEKIRRKPYSVVLFDEIEKAHPDVLNILLQILDDGRITDSHGKEVNFENTVIIMTTNAGSKDVSAAAGFTATVKSSDYDRVKKALEDFLRPEFLNRVDEIVVFNRLTKENFSDICKIMLGDLQEVLAEKGITLEYDDKAIAYLVNKGYSEKYGARNLRRLIQTDVEDPIAAKIIESYASPIKHVFVTAEGDSISIVCN